MVKIQVTQAHIDKGCRFNTNSCPVALALQDIFGEGCSVFNYIHTPGNLPVQTPPSVFRAIRKYDKDTTMIPFDFEINQPRKAFNES